MSNEASSAPRRRTAGCAPSSVARPSSTPWTRCTCGRARTTRSGTCRWPTSPTARFVPTGTEKRSPSRGTASHYTIKAGGKEAVDAAWRYADSPIEELRDRVRIDWSAMDAWFEEDEEVIIHPRDPAARIAILPSSRHVVVSVDGVVVADSTHPTFLHETGLPMRTYLPKVDVRMDLLTADADADRVPLQGLGRVLDAAPPRRRRAPPTSRGATRRRCASRTPWPAWWRSTTTTSTSRSTAWRSPDRRADACSPPRRGERNPLLPNGPRSALART